MTENTALDDAHEKMQAAPDDDTARLGFYERLSDSELFLLLSKEPSNTAQNGTNDDEVEPEIFEHEGQSYVLVFDRDDRLAEFVGAPAPYAAMPGRVIANLLLGQNIGLGVNLGVAPSSILLPASAVSWLSETLKTSPTEVSAHIDELKPPFAPEALLKALDVKLGSAVGLARLACLAAATYNDGRQGHLLGFIDARDGAQNALAGAVHEALIFCGLEAGEMDVGFFTSQDQIAQKLTSVGVVFELPTPAVPEQILPTAPGSNPDKPPILK